MIRALESARALARSKEAPAALLRSAWAWFSPLPGGKRVFSEIIGRSAPYTGTVGAVVEELRPGYSRVRMPDRPGNRNHLRCVHAVALVNLVELTGNLALSFALPEDARFIVSGISIEYHKKARGPITGVCHAPRVTSPERREYPITVELSDEAGVVVATGKVRTLVGPTRG